MAEQFKDIGMKYCPSCRNILAYNGNGRYECLLCCTHVVVLDKDPDIFYEVPFTNEEREAYYLARKEGIRNRVFFEREREREAMKREAVRNEQSGLKHCDNKQRKMNPLFNMQEVKNINIESVEEKKEEITSDLIQDLLPNKKCIVCGRGIQSGSYCKECTFVQIKKMQRKDLMGDRSSIVTDNYGNMRYKGYQDE